MSESGPSGKVTDFDSKERERYEEFETPANRNDFDQITI